MVTKQKEIVGDEASDEHKYSVEQERPVQRKNKGKKLETQR